MGGPEVNAKAPKGLFSMLQSVVNPEKQNTDITPPPNMSDANAVVFFIKMSFDLLQNSNYSKKIEGLQTAITEARNCLDSGSGGQLLIFKPFQMVCYSGNAELTTIAVDCLAKLFSYRHWDYNEKVPRVKNPKLDKKVTENVDEEEQQPAENQMSMIAYIIDTICDSFTGEKTDEKLQIQIIKALQAALAVQDVNFRLHGQVLLKVIRTTYNIFLVSNSNEVQEFAQRAVHQMVLDVFGNVMGQPAEQEIKANYKTHGRTTSVQKTLLAHIKERGATSTVTTTPAEPKDINKVKTEPELVDAYLVFRTLCILSIKALPNPELNRNLDLRAKPIRSKLLSLYLLASILKTHGFVFHLDALSLWDLCQDPKKKIESFSFLDAVKEFLILSLSRNSTSVVIPIFEGTITLFGELWIETRSLMKKELEIFFTEIVLHVLETTKIPWHQKHTLLKQLTSIFSQEDAEGGKMLVEIYLNYDCDIGASEKGNIWERLVNAVARVTSLHISNANTTPFEPIPSYLKVDGYEKMITNANLSNLTRDHVFALLSSDGNPIELRKQGLRFLCIGILKPLYDWLSRPLEAEQSESAELLVNNTMTPIADLTIDENGMAEDDPKAIELLKQKKQSLNEGIRLFATDYKKGIASLQESGCIPSLEPEVLAQFLMEHEQLNKTQLGILLGEGDSDSIKIMHAFVDLFQFNDIKIVPALRMFLSHFRLPGEAQKIDRLMLKFAEIYHKGNPNQFSSADTAYVLAYSIIMLNTDQHNPQVKNKMTKQGFMKNNRGIDNGNNLSEEFLSDIFDDIAQNEIAMKDEVKKREPGQNSSKTNLFIRNESIAQKTEDLLRRKVGNDRFVSALHTEHVKPMFESTWMSVMTGLSNVMIQSDDPETIAIALDGLQHAIRISCFFDMGLVKEALFTTLCKYTYLNNFNEMRAKHFEAIKVLLSVAHLEANQLESSWKDVVNCISLLEVFVQGSTIEQLKIWNKNKRRETGNAAADNTQFLETVVKQSSQVMELSVDKIFASSAKLSGTAILHFVKALCDVSWEEITTSQDKERPRMYSLQRLIEISFYNMNRIRVEWSQIWAVLGAHFDQVGSYPNTAVGFFAIDKFRQLATQFLDLEELPNFKFQQEFLHPFAVIMKNNADLKIKDMVLTCTKQILQLKRTKLKSGWRAICKTLQEASVENQDEKLLTLMLEIEKDMLLNNFKSLVINGCLRDFVTALVNCAKITKPIKFNLLAVDLLKQACGIAADVTKGLKKAADEIHSIDDVWIPLFVGLRDMIIFGEVEVRTAALQILYDTLEAKDNIFQKSTWKLIAKDVLLAIFNEMKNNNQQSPKSVDWISTTLIQVFRRFVDLFGKKFQHLNFMLADALEIFKMSVLHDNEVLTRIGTVCMEQIVELNTSNFGPKDWKLVTEVICSLFDATAPKFLFFRMEKYNGSSPDSQYSTWTFLDGPPGSPPEKKAFQAQISKCGKHLMVIQTLQNIFKDGSPTQLHTLIPADLLDQILESLERSYRLAEVFNDSLELRKAIYALDYMNQMPNLLKQETLSGYTYLSILFRMSWEQGQKINGLTIEEKLVPLCVRILYLFGRLEPDNSRSIGAWKPVIMVIMSGLINMGHVAFGRNVKALYMPCVSLLNNEQPEDIRKSLLQFLQKAGKNFGTNQ